ncbi:hypothetical protein HHI36_020287 [Cryptolaemus montrouzieri]|uniref:Small nuclear ribonucleoprotein Sm D2 n=1 Tax=Cryptolaemus montrouzieri TaxID=559131 RepID=A0ABD2NA79_9CUCU
MTTVQNVKVSAEYRIGPLSILQDSVEHNIQILISCRNNKKLLARVKSFDKHMNMVLENVREMWTEEPRKGKGKSKKPIYKDRFMKKVFLRGDSILIVLRNPLTERDDVMTY